MGNLYLTLEEDKYGKLTGSKRNSCLYSCLLLFSPCASNRTLEEKQQENQVDGHHHEYFDLCLSVTSSWFWWRVFSRLMDGFLFIFVYYYKFGRK